MRWDVAWLFIKGNITLKDAMKVDAVRKCYKEVITAVLPLLQMKYTGWQLM